MKNRNASLDTKKKKAEPSTGYASGASRGGSSEKEASETQPGPECAVQKDRILREREERKQKERDRTEKALQQIRYENYMDRIRAQEKLVAMYQPSTEGSLPKIPSSFHPVRCPF